MLRPLALALVLVGGCPTARAQSPPESRPLEFVPRIDAPVLSIAATAWLGLALAQKAIIPHPTCDPCHAATVNPFDRGVAGWRNEVANGISWGSAALTLALPIAIDAIAQRRNWRAFGHDVGIFAETIAIDGALNEIVKLSVRRPRPFVYDGSLSTAARTASDGYVSFYSEHSSVTFAAATAYTVLFALRHRDRPGLSALVGTALFSLAVLTSSLRVVAGKHFPSDVLVGSAVGTAIGATVPLLHYYVPRRAPIHVAIVPIPSGALLTISRSD